ncbi:MAG: glycosyltransferase [Chitinophagales bacterium]|nr:glycosyltransferase [Chitinophagaceae bacterium]MCB9063655.1 glycosyltransferase [Chitinophagales bacterium]
MTPNSPLVTVLLPAYNAAPYMKEAVDSVLAQTFKDFELLVINDGSTDGTGEILRSYTDERVWLVEQENMGLVRTLNKGIELAKGKYIARFDADDVCYPDRLEVQMKFFQEHPDYIIVASEADYMDEDGNFVFKYTFSHYEDEEIRASGLDSCPFIHSSVTVLRQALIDAGGYNDKAITFEDHLLWKNIAAFGKMKVQKLSLIKVRLNPSSATIDERWRGKEFVELKERSIKNGDVSDEDFKTLVHILKSQDFTEYKKAAYHSMLGKKYLWNQHKPRLARKHLREAIKHMPKKPEPYLLYLLSYLPGGLIEAIYHRGNRD